MARVQGNQASAWKAARKCRLAIISNIDNDIIEKTKSNIGIEFAFTVTAQEARAYKPKPKPFQIALKKLRAKSVDILHVSSGFRYDVPPARQLGFKTAWVNRKSEQAPRTGRADYEFSSLTELANFVETIE